ncbi:SF1B family DNA helicase RecD2 [Virgibacillus sp. W0181]|uniref:SF1B family DNA helicase RecD2 n=1 Tax=Virgibacillus sp. W0181 TaxID=3391581 RepID=UPI003F4635BB
MAIEKFEKSNNENSFIRGELLYTIFHNTEEHFSIAKIKIHQTNEDFKEKEVVVKGYFSKLQDGTVYTFMGEFEKHEKFGLQYKIHAFQTYIPTSEDGLVDYLSSDLFYGVGKRTAQKIVEHLGSNAVSKIMNSPDVLASVPRLTKKTRETLVETLQENQGFEHVVVFLSKYHIGLKMAQKIYENYKETSIEQVKKDPFQFVLDIEGFGFHTADQIAKTNGLSLTHPNRIGAGCIYVLQNSVQNGHVYLPLDQCVQETYKLLITPDINEQMITECIEDLNKEKKLIVVEGKAYLPSLYYAEDGFASNVNRLIDQSIEQKTTLAELMKIIGEIEELEVLSYGEEQFKAINEALHSKIMILTGGPGTGKTTVIKGIINAYASIHDVSTNRDDYDNKADFPFVLSAPTGRAAKRLQQSTGIYATTIHRLLGWDGNEFFERNENEPLSGQLLIIDEFSMVDIWVAHALFKAIPDHMQVLLVGDEDQLPSVGPGQVLSDLLSTNLLPSITLQEVYRQEEGSKIIELAHRIRRDTCTAEILENKRDFSFIPCTEQQAEEVILNIFTKAIDKGIDPKDIQVLAPMYRTRAGILAINKQLQQLLNPPSRQKREKRIKDTIYRIGDKVIQLTNRPEDGISNGDIGTIAAIFEEDENVENTEQIVISFDRKEVVYERKDYIEIMHAYCISIHKSQGSEFPIVILPVLPAYNRMLRKNLLYTAITRSKQSLIICGVKQAFLKGVHTLDTNIRFTNLKEQLMRRLDDVPEIQEHDSSEDEISPYDFI